MSTRINCETTLDEVNQLAMTDDAIYVKAKVCPFVLRDRSTELVFLPFWIKLINLLDESLRWNVHTKFHLMTTGR